MTTHYTIGRLYVKLSSRAEPIGIDRYNLQRRGFFALSTMSALHALSMSYLNVDDAGVSALRKSPALRELMPIDAPDTTYQHIGKCAHLESLMYCRNTTDAATEHITGMPKLSYYFNSYTMITDPTPALLSEMDSLERITFHADHGLTDAGIARLAQWPRLRELCVSGEGAMSRPASPVHFLRPSPCLRAVMISASRNVGRILHAAGR